MEEGYHAKIEMTQENRDPSAETVVKIWRTLKKIDPQASEEFVMLYLYSGDEENP